MTIEGGEIGSKYTKESLRTSSIYSVRGKKVLFDRPTELRNQPLEDDEVVQNQPKRSVVSAELPAGAIFASNFARKENPKSIRQLII